MKLTHLGTDSGDTGCPSVFATDRGTFVVQGWRITDSEAHAELQRRGLPEHETAVEIPVVLLRHLLSGVTMLSRDEFQQLFDREWSTAWRWECQGAYNEPQEQEPLERFLAGETDQSWFKWPKRVRAWADQGRSIGRVRMLTDPLTDYLRFELSITPPALDAGEDIRFLTEARARELGAPDQDYWMFDEAEVAMLIFGDHGVSGALLITEPTIVRRYVNWRDLAVREAVPYSSLT